MKPEPGSCPARPSLDTDMDMDVFTSVQNYVVDHVAFVFGVVETERAAEVFGSFLGDCRMPGLHVHSKSRSVGEEGDNGSSQEGSSEVPQLSIRDVWCKKVQMPLSPVRAAPHRGCSHERHVSRGICRLLPSKQQTLPGDKIFCCMGCSIQSHCYSRDSKRIPILSCSLSVFRLKRSVRFLWRRLNF